MRNGKFRHTLLFLGALALLQGVAFAQRERSRGIVDSVANIDVVREAPLRIDIDVVEGQIVAGVNFVIEVSLRNVATQSVSLRGFSVDEALPYVWASLNGGEFQRGTRIHPDSISLPSAGTWTTEIMPGESLDYRVFLSNHDVADPQMADVQNLAIVLCPVLTVIDAGGEKAIAIESNILNVALLAPTRHDRRGLVFLTELAGRRGAEYVPLLEQHKLFLARYPNSPYAPRVHYKLVRDSRGDLEQYHEINSPVDALLLNSIEFCFAKGPPFSEILLSKEYIEFFARNGRWDSLLQSARLLGTMPEYDRRFDYAQLRIGELGLFVDSDEFGCRDASWRDKLRPVLLKCLKRALARGDDETRRLTLYMLPKLTGLKEWKLLERAAELALQDNANNSEAQQALLRAKAELATVDSAQESP